MILSPNWKLPIWTVLIVMVLTDTDSETLSKRNVHADTIGDILVNRNVHADTELERKDKVNEWKFKMEKVG